MRLGVLFSGGKDSTLALQYAMEKEEVPCLITLVSENKESFMFHTPNIDVSCLQAEAIGLPQIRQITKGEKEKELEDLEIAIIYAKNEYHIDGIVTGAVESVYQAQRIQGICHHLGLWCFNPLWKRNQKNLLEELLEKDYEIIISGIFAYPLDETWLGRHLNQQMINRLVELQEKYGLSPTGEGGEIETTVLEAPIFKKKIKIVDSKVECQGNAGVFTICQARLVQK